MASHGGAMVTVDEENDETRGTKHPLGYLDL